MVAHNAVQYGQIFGESKKMRALCRDRGGDVGGRGRIIQRLVSGMDVWIGDGCGRRTKVECLRVA